MCRIIIENYMHDTMVYMCEPCMHKSICLYTHQAPLIRPFRIVWGVVGLLAHCPGHLLLDIANLYHQCMQHEGRTFSTYYKVSNSHYAPALIYWQDFVLDWERLGVGISLKRLSQLEIVESGSGCQYHQSVEME